MAYATKEGEEECGDTYLVKEHEDCVLLAVIDGLGHGLKAAEASRKAVELLGTFHEKSIISLIKHCHDGLKDTRGVVMSLAQIDYRDKTIAWIGVGNVDGALWFADNENRTKTERFLLKRGIVGYRLPLLQATITPISRGDLLVISTDGVQISYLKTVELKDDPQKIVKEISKNYFKNSDDSLILAAKYIGNSEYV